MKLCNFSNTQYHLDWYGGQWEQLKNRLEAMHIEGIELLLHGNQNIEGIPKSLVKGLHLSYYPTWMDFYKQDPVYLEDFPTPEDLKQAFGGDTPKAMVDRYKMEYEIAQSLEADYMVFHVGHVRLKDAFTFSYTYNDEEVLKATASFVNEIFDEDSKVMLLFENLWWPGLRMSNASDINKFMEQITYENKGIMLDLSHLLLTAQSIHDFDEALDYLHKKLDELDDAVRWIKGVHINGTLFKDYMQQSHHEAYEALPKEQNQRFMAIYEHIKQMDQHLPFTHEGLKTLIKRIGPKYQMIELVGKDRDTWEQMIEKQMEYL